MKQMMEGLGSNLGMLGHIPAWKNIAMRESAAKWRRGGMPGMGGFPACPDFPACPASPD